MNITFLGKEKESKRLSFILKDCNASFANALRRVMITEVPTMAIEDVEFRKNNSILYDEMIAHRLGLIPFVTDLKSYNLPQGCSCNAEGCAKCQLKLTLKGKGPKTIYASDIKSTDPKVIPVFPKTIIVKLLKGQEIEFEATAILGQGKEHAKWNTGSVHYKNEPEIEIKNDSFNGCEEVAKQCPEGIFEMKGNKITVNKAKTVSCTLCEACVDACPKGEIQVHGKENNFVFSIESWGQLDCKEIAKLAANILQQKFETFNEEIQKVK